MGEALLDRMGELNTVLPDLSFLHYIEVSLRLMTSLDETQREIWMAMLAEKQTDAEFEERVVELGRTFQRDEQKVGTTHVNSEPGIYGIICSLEYG